MFSLEYRTLVEHISDSLTVSCNHSPNLLRGNNGDRYIQTEADILISDLASVKGYTLSELLDHDMAILTSLAMDIVNTVDMHIDGNNEPRLILSLLPHNLEADMLMNAASHAVKVSSNSCLMYENNPDKSTTSISLINPRPMRAVDPLEHGDASTNHDSHDDAMKEGFEDEPDHESDAPIVLGTETMPQSDQQGVSQEDLVKILTDKSAVIGIRKTLSVPIVLFENAVSPRLYIRTKSPHTKAIHPETDYVLMNLHISISGDNQETMTIAGIVEEESELEYEYSPALEAKAELVTHIGLPSLVQADADMMFDYMSNLAQCCVVHHNISSGHNALTVRTE